MRFSDTLISPKQTRNLTAATSIEATDVIEIESDGSPKKVTMNDLDNRNRAHPRYYFMGYAGDQIAGDGKFFDKSALRNHAIRGANLSDTQMFANAGYISTVDPAGGAADSVLRIPALNYDYNAGERLIFWWLGKATAEVSAVEWVGDGNSATYPGVTVRCTATTGTLQPFFRSSTTPAFAATTVTPVMNGSLNSFAMVFDGVAKTYCLWVNETPEAAFSGGFLQFNSGNPIDSRSVNTFNIGQATPAAAASTAGLATQTRALHIIRLSATDPMPTQSELTAMFSQLRAEPGRPISGGAW